MTDHKYIQILEATEIRLEKRVGELEEFVYIMIKEGATTLSNARTLLGFNSMEEAIEWLKALTPCHVCNQSGTHKLSCHNKDEVSISPELQELLDNTRPVEECLKELKENN